MDNLISGRKQGVAGQVLVQLLVRKAICEFYGIGLLLDRTGLEDVMAAVRLSDDVLNELEQLCERRKFKVGETITTKGDKHKSMFFILSGWVQIWFLDDGGDTHSLRVGERSILGEMGFLSGKSAVATANVVSPVTALELDQETLDRLEEKNPQAAAELSLYLTNTVDRRLRSD
ncbi:MAG: cyclic nucleotide-binding domain-containing protein [Hyphomicrobiales bacterium]|nr:cyclic nucleotide-binding domain-containing protein [Hyphomicrobiales bacterium]